MCAVLLHLLPTRSVGLRRPYCSGGCRPGDVSHLSRLEAVLSWRSLRSRRSRCGPGCVFSSSAMRRARSAFRLLLMWDCGCRPMALSFPCVNWEGAQPAFSSPIQSTVIEPMCTRNRSDARTKVDPANVYGGSKRDLRSGSGSRAGPNGLPCCLMPPAGTLPSRWGHRRSMGGSASPAALRMTARSASANIKRAGSNGGASGGFFSRRRSQAHSSMG
ncbi:hypothetical protein AB7M11_003805 [Bradyrhizobium ottawaense]